MKSPKKGITKKNNNETVQRLKHENAYLKRNIKLKDDSLKDLKRRNIRENARIGLLLSKVYSGKVTMQELVISLEQLQKNIDEQITTQTAFTEI